MGTFIYFLPFMISDTETFNKYFWYFYKRLLDIYIWLSS